MLSPKKVLKTLPPIIINLQEIKGSINNLLIPSKNKKRLVYSGNYRKAKEVMKSQLEENYSVLKQEGEGLPERLGVQVSYTFFDNWLTKKGTLRKKDVNNYIKNIEDVVFDFINIDDKNIVESRTYKKVSEEKKIIINIRVFEY